MTRHTTWRCAAGRTHEAVAAQTDTDGLTVTTLCGKTATEVAAPQLDDSAVVTCPACRTEQFLIAASRETAA